MKHIKLIWLSAALTLIVTAGPGSSSASAASLVSEGNAGYLIAVPTSRHVFDTTSSSTFACDGPNFTGGEFSGKLAMPDIVTTYLGDYRCGIFGSNTPLKTNGCRYTFHPGAETSPGEFQGTFDIGPAGCGPMTMKYHAGFCELTIPAQNGLGVRFRNVGSGSKATVEISVSAGGLKSADKACGSDSSGSYVGRWILEGRSYAGMRVGIRLASPVLFINGEGSIDPNKQPKISSDFYPIGVRGDGTQPFSFSTPNTEAQCSTSQYLGLGAELAPVASKLLTASYSECTAFGFSNTRINMNSCELMFKVANQGPPYVGTVELVCSQAGDAMEINPRFWGFDICTVSIPPQSLGLATYSNAGTGNSRHIDVTIQGNGIEYAEDPEAPNCEVGAGSDGTISTTVDLIGFDQ